MAPRFPNAAKNRLSSIFMTSVSNGLNAGFIAIGQARGSGAGQRLAARTREDGGQAGAMSGCDLERNHDDPADGNPRPVAHYSRFAAQCSDMVTDAAAADIACSAGFRPDEAGFRPDGTAVGLDGAGLRADGTAVASPRAGTTTDEVEIPLPGGDMTEGVVRVGGTVRRPVRPHTAAVHALLRHLEEVGFDGAPRVLGVDAKNREVLTYLPGEVPRRPLPGYALAESTLVALAELQRDYHEAVAGFTPPPWARWDGELTALVDSPATIVCHCDINLENVIFRNEAAGLRPYAFIDFDLARPGTRLVDIIQTLRYWAPIAEPADRDPALRDPDCCLLRGVRPFLRRAGPPGSGRLPVAAALAGHDRAARADPRRGLGAHARAGGGGAHDALGAVAGAQPPAHRGPPALTRPAAASLRVGCCDI
jgi:hypothetical protein